VFILDDMPVLTGSDLSNLTICNVTEEEPTTTTTTLQTPTKNPQNILKDAFTALLKTEKNVCISNLFLLVAGGGVGC